MFWKVGAKMKTIILYESKMGYTKKCAEYLHQKMENSDLFDIEKAGFVLKDYEQIVIGAPIYIGKVEDYTRDFINRNKLTLLDRKLKLFFTGMNKEEYHIAVQDSLPVDIFYEAQIVFPGGIIDYSMLSLRDKYTIWRRLKIRQSVNDAHLENLDELLKDKE